MRASTGLKIKLVVVLGVFLWAVWVAVPQFIPLLTHKPIPKSISSLLYGEKLNLGLDLQGGVHLVLGLDVNRVIKETLQRELNAILESFEKEKLDFETHKLFVEDGHHILRLDFPSSDAKVKADQYLEKNFPFLIVHFEEEKALLLKLDDREVTDLRQKTLDQSIEVLRNRIDEFGVKEPIISKTGVDRIQVQFPGMSETERIKSIISRTAKLEFRMVDKDSLSQPALEAIMAKAAQAGIKFVEKTGISIPDFTAKLNAFAKEDLPTGTVIRLKRMEDDRTQETSYVPILVKDEVPLTGLHIQDARVGVDQDTQLPEVNLTLNPVGTKIFGDLTKDNVGERNAIILDDVVMSDPTIISHIPSGRVRITLGRFRDYQRLFQEASNLVVVLRAGSLPTTLEFLEERTVGPSLGSDSIHSGALSAVAGGILVLLFLIVYYGAVGCLAAFSLIFNSLLLLALLTTLGATLTLPGIAGIVLTFGMSVDANIIVFERIRENLRRGRSISGAVTTGYEKALITILDSNITTIFAGIILLQYGTGAIKGFAVTLILGILTSLFTAYFSAKLFSEWIYNKPDIKTIRIGIPFEIKRR